MNIQLPQNELQELLNYDPESGIFTWKTSCKAFKEGDIAGSRNSDEYVRIRIQGRNYYGHRLAWLFMSGEWPPREVDHRNGVKSDNRKSNLRLASGSENKWNTGIRKSNTSGVKGVHWCNTSRRWVAKIRVDKRRICLGYFRDKLAASESIEIARASLHGDFARS